MLKSYLKIAWRSLWKNKGYSSLNIFGLAIGITCACLILLWVEDEVNYDSYFPKQDLVYYVPTNQTYEGEVYTFYSTPGPLAKDLKDEIPEITKSATTWRGEILLKSGDMGINRRGTYVEPDFLDIFSLHFLEGEAKNALERPDAIVLTKKTANALFEGADKALGQTVQINGKHIFTVTGIVEDLPQNVTFGFDWLLPLESFGFGEEDVSWTLEYGNNFADTFVELAPNANFKEVDAKVRAFIPSKMKEEENPTVAFLHSIKDWHLRSSFKEGRNVGGQISLVRSVVFIAFIILLIACINFMNLSTARSEKRANEVGIRKVLGSGKGKLMSQFMLESIIMAGLSAVLSLVLLVSLLPSFNTLVNKQIDLSLGNPVHLFSLFGITLICGLLAGWHPAFYLSSFRPSHVLKGVGKNQGSAVYIRKGLVITQFAVSVIFIISSILIYQQIQHVKARDVGYGKGSLVNITVNGNMVSRFNSIRQEMIASGTVADAALTNTTMLSDGNNGSGLRWQGGTDTDDVLVRFRYVNPTFFNTMGLKILEGHGFNDNIAADSTNILITESFAALMGKGSAVGKTVTRGGTDYNVIGVVNDYLYGDMYGNGKTGPVMFFNDPEYANTLYVKIKPMASTTEALASIEETLKEYNPAFPFEYRFENELFNARFRNEVLVGELASIFSVLAIIISCLGLFGLAAYTAEQRKKEIGVRKVLGANVFEVVRLLSKDFMKLVLVALGIAFPIAFWIMTNWLQKFAYRIDVGWDVFIFSGAVAIFIALLTVSFQSIKAALSNPTKSLRTE